MNETLFKEWEQKREELNLLEIEILKTIAMEAVNKHAEAFKSVNKEPHYFRFSIEEKKDYYYVGFTEWLDEKEEEITLDYDADLALRTSFRAMLEEQFDYLDDFIPVLNSVQSIKLN